MPSELITWAHAYLEQDDEIVVPIKRMWNEWHAAHSEPSHEAFTATVLADKRIEEMGGVDHTEGMERMSPEELEEYERGKEEAGFYSGPRVKLKSRVITMEHIAKMIKKHNDRMEAALQAARDSMPEDIDEREEGQLIDAIEMAKEMRRKLREAGLEPSEDSQQNEKEAQ